MIRLTPIKQMFEWLEHVATVEEDPVGG